MSCTEVCNRIQVQFDLIQLCDGNTATRRVQRKLKYYFREQRGQNLVEKVGVSIPNSSLSARLT